MVSPDHLSPGFPFAWTSRAPYWMKPEGKFIYVFMYNYTLLVILSIVTWYQLPWHKPKPKAVVFSLGAPGPWAVLISSQLPHFITCYCLLSFLCSLVPQMGNELQECNISPLLWNYWSSILRFSIFFFFWNIIADMSKVLFLWICNNLYLNHVITFRAVRPWMIN